MPGSSSGVETLGSGSPGISMPSKTLWIDHREIKKRISIIEILAYCGLIKGDTGKGWQADRTTTYVVRASREGEIAEPGKFRFGSWGVEASHLGRLKIGEKGKFIRNFRLLQLPSGARQDSCMERQPQVCICGTIHSGRVARSGKYSRLISNNQRTRDTLKGGRAPRSVCL